MHELQRQWFLLWSIGSRARASVVEVPGLSCPGVYGSLPRPRMNPMSPELAGGVSTGPPGSPKCNLMVKCLGMMYTDLCNLF